ncbi:hypothetical protein ISP17_17810 [Dyella ginsengisoli]|uniref:Uncharacterized protein n=1 Tax=Dyella ginsengisoli TaxID=363848 RepID=A0ABW8JXD5_9GAMM
MVRWHPLLMLLIGVIAMDPRAAAAQEDKAWRDAQVAAAEKSERIMATAARRKDLLGQYRVMMDAATAAPAEDRAFNIIFSQYLSWYQSFIGDYPNAQASYSISQPTQPDDAPSPLAAGWQMQDARDAIARLAKGRQVVLFNEAHNVPLTRTLTVAMLATLRAEGFNYFAVETLYGDDHALAKRGYVTADSGFYTREPIYAEMVRTALKLGFTVVAYESDQPGTADERERAQARNLYDRVFRHDPKARLVVNAGYAHIQESGAYLGGRSMAQYLQQLDDIDALTVEQTMLIPHPQATQDHPWYTAAMATRHPDEPFVFVDHDGKPWSLRPGYDVSVFFPLPRMRRERPTWLSLWGLRRPYFVSGDAACAQRWPCLVEALPANEGDDAVAADRLLFDPPPNPPPLHDRVRPLRGATAGELYLRPGDYRLRITGADGRISVSQSVRIPAR